MTSGTQGRLSRRDLVALAAGAAAAGIAAPSWAAQSAPLGGPQEDYFYRDDFFGEPWRTPEAAVLIHGNDELSVVWYGWMPQMAREFRVIRPDLPAFGRSKVPPGFEWSLPSLAMFVARIMDRAGVQSAHIVGAKTGGAIAMQFAADYPARTRTLSIASGPASVIQVSNPSPIPQHDRLGTGVSKEMVEYWNTMFANAPEVGAAGLRTALSKFDLARDGVLQRITSPEPDHDSRSQRAPVRGEGQGVSAGDSEVAPRGPAQRRLPHRRRQRGRMRRQRPRLHQGDEARQIGRRRWL